MELSLLADFEQTANRSSVDKRSPSLPALHTALSLISNTFTSHTTLLSLSKILTGILQNPDLNSIPFEHILSLISALCHRDTDLRHELLLAVRTIALSSSTPTPSLARSLSVLFNYGDVTDDFADECLFLSLCFRPCKSSVRYWLLRHVNKFRARPSVLVTVLLGFTKDPYPFTRKAALDGLAWLCKFIKVEDQSLVQGCYFRAVELLFDSEDAVRCSAVHAMLQLANPDELLTSLLSARAFIYRHQHLAFLHLPVWCMVSEWGQLIVACNQVKRKSDWSDALFVQLCSVVRDMSMKVRVEAFHALASVRIVSEDILLQTLSKKASSAIKGKSYPGQYIAKLFELPASCAAFAFVHGLEDEFYEVRRSACYALGKLTTLSADFAFEAVNILMDMLNDDSVVVRLQALETMHHTAMSGHLQVQEGHLHMLLGTLVDCSTLIRSAARSVLRLTRLNNSAMFKLCFEGLVKNLELYPQDEADIFFVLFNIGQHHGKLVALTIQGASEEMEPLGSMLGYENARRIALLVLAIAAPILVERSICSIPAIIFSYAAILLKRISHGLAGILSMNDLLAYLSHCSRFTFVSISEFFEGERPAFPVVKGDMQGWQRSYEFYQDQIEKILKLLQEAQPVLAYQLETPEAARKSAKIMLQKVKDIWPFIRCGCSDEVTRTLRSWKEELKNFMSDSLQSMAELGFTLQYLRILKWLGRVWMHCRCPATAHPSGPWKLEILLSKLDRIIREIRYGFIGLNKEVNVHLLELVILSCTLKISYAKGHCLDATLEKLHSTVSLAERLHEGSSLELPSFMVKLRKLLQEFALPSNETVGYPLQLRKALDFFSLRQVELSGILKHVKAELEVCNNSYEKPCHYVPGLPVGIPLQIKLYNLSSENRLWLKMTQGEKLSQFVFLDLEGVSSCDEVKEFTFVAPFYSTPKASYFLLNVCIVMECLSEQIRPFNSYGGPKHELMNLCRDKEVYLSRLVK